MKLRNNRLFRERRADGKWLGSTCLGLTDSLRLCGAVLAIGREVWSLDKALNVHLAAAPVIAFLLSGVHKLLAPEFDPLLRAMTMAGIIIVLDVVVVAPIFERSYAMSLRTF